MASLLRSFFAASSVTALLQVACASQSNTGDVPVQRLWRAEFQYPSQLINDEEYIRGSVTLQVSFDERASINHIDVLSADHPAFIAPAIESVLASRFAPATHDGKPVPAKLTLLNTFEVKQAGLRVGTPPQRVAVKPKGLPAEFNWDFPPVLLTFCEPVYPRALLLAGERGKAEVRLVVDPAGRVSEVAVNQATKPEFGAALAAAVQTWRFLPARRATKPITTVIVQQHEFLPASYHRSETEKRVLSVLKKNGVLVEAASLDQPLRPLLQVPPIYPVTLAREGTTGEATVEFVVARTGQAVLPVVSSAARPEFGEQAAVAISQWFFAPPLANGKPVDVRARMTFEFRPAGAK